MLKNHLSLFQGSPGLGWQGFKAWKGWKLQKLQKCRLPAEAWIDLMGCCLLTGRSQKLEFLAFSGESPRERHNLRIEQSCMNIVGQSKVSRAGLSVRLLNWVPVPHPVGTRQAVCCRSPPGGTCFIINVHQIWVCPIAEVQELFWPNIGLARAKLLIWNYNWIFLDCF